MTTQKERVDFITRFRDEYPKRPREECVKAAGLLLRYAREHGRLAVEECNGPGEYINRVPYPRAGELIAAWQADLEKRQERIGAKIVEVCAPFKLPVILGGDPRGSTVRVKFPSGVYNTWGGAEHGYGVPQ